MSRRRQINSDPQGRGGRLAGLFELVRLPFERPLWLLEERVLWPLREATAGRLPNRRGAGAAALVAIAAVAVVAAVLLLPGGETPGERVAQPAKVAIAQTPTPEPAPGAGAGPEPRETARTELQGARPDFSVGAAGGLAGTAAPSGSASSGGESGSSGSGDTESGASGDGGGTDSGDAADTAGAAATSAREPVPPGPRAMRIARRFSEAFVFYEIGKRRDRAEEVFAKTATPRLAKALAERPPRQPAAGEVPRARIVNLVPGPRAGRAYTVSASLLRVGLTTELRLELRRDGKRQWRVTDVRG